MMDLRACPRCGQELPDDSPRGLCPACLLGVAMASPEAAGALGSEGDSDETTDASKGRADTSGGSADASAAGPERATAPATIRYFGDFEVQEELGRGGMGVVCRARQVSLNRPVALKLIRAGGLAGDDELRRFQNEAEAVAMLDHPGIVPIYEVGEHDGQRYFSMKLVPGGNLAYHLAAYRDDPKAAATLLARVAEAVHHAHMRGILHRDLKPANILVDDEGHPHVTDFGLAKWVEADTEMTASGAILGTPAYMAPEQAMGRRGTITTATDVYGLGAVLYALLTGRAPFLGDSVVDTLSRVKEQSPEPPRKLNAKVPRDLEVICLKCLEKDPRRRYSSAQALADDVRAWLEARPIAARPVGPMEQAALFVRRRPAVATAYMLSAVVLVLVGFGGSLAWLWREAEGARTEAVSARDSEARTRTAAERARDGEARARTAAERARDGEARARAEAEKARDGEARARAEAERQREKSERSDYGRTMNIAQQKWRENNIAGALSLLNATRPDFRGWEWHYIHRLCHPELLTLEGHTGDVHSASFSPDGSRIVTAGADGMAKVWDARTGVETLSLKGHSNRVHSAFFSPDGSRVLTASSDGKIKVWDATSGSPVLTFGGGFSYTGAVFSASLSADGSRLVTISAQNSGTVWDAKTGAEVRHLNGPTQLITSASFSPDGSRIVTGSRDKTAKVWDAKTGADVFTLNGHTGTIGSALFSPDGTRIVTASWDKTAKVWDAKTAAEVVSLKGHSAEVRWASFSPDGSRIVTAADDRTAKVWDAKTGVEVLSLKGHSGSVNSARFSPDGSQVVTSSLDGTARVWDANTGSQFPIAKWRIPGAISGTFSPDGTRIVTAALDQKARVWDARRGSELLILEPHIMIISDQPAHLGFHPTHSASFSPDGTRIVTAGLDKTAKVWDAKTGTEILSLAGHLQLIRSASFSPDGSTIVTGSNDRTAKVWDAKTGAEVLSFTKHASAIESASFSPDGTWIVTASADKTAKVWDAKSGAEVVSLEGHTDMVLSAAFSPDGSLIVTASADETAKVWDAKTGDEILSLRGHSGWVPWASFSPDGSRLLTASADGTAKVWDAKTGVEVISLEGHIDAIYSASFSPDGSRIVTTGLGQDTTVIVWDAGPNAHAMARGGEPAADRTLPTARQPGPLAQDEDIESKTSTRIDAPRNEPAKPARSRILPPPGASSVDALLNDLRKNGKGQLADELTREIKQSRDELVLFNRVDPRGGGHVMVGRVVGEGLVDPSRVVSQMRIHREGYFVGAVRGSDAPVVFRKQGFLPVAITPNDEPGHLEYLGEVRLEPLPEAMRSALKGKVVYDGPTGAYSVASQLWTNVGPFNGPVVSEAMRAYGPDSVDVPMSRSGEFLCSGLSPLECTITFKAPGAVTLERPVNLRPGETVDLGIIRLGSLRRIDVSYRVAPRPPFNAGPLRRKTIPWDGVFRAEDAPGGNFDLRFDQLNDEIRFQNSSCKIADMGPGELKDFLQADPPPLRLTRPSSLNPQPDHVYLIEQPSLKHWVLFQFTIDQQAPERQATVPASRPAVSPVPKVAAPKPAAPPSDTQPEVARGFVLMQMGKHAAATDAFREAIRLKPGDASAHFNLGSALIAQKKFDEAVTATLEAIRLNPKFGSAYANLGGALKALGKYEEAIAAYSEAIRLKPNVAQTHFALGQALMSQKKFDQAVLAYRDAIRLDPKYGPAYVTLGSALKSQGKLDEAIAAYHDSIHMDPKFGMAYFNLGGALKAQGKLDEAIAAYREATRRMPDHGPTYKNLGDALNMQGKTEEAAAIYRQADRLTSGLRPASAAAP